MQHFYSGIKGWFAFQAIYEQAVKEAKDGAHFVEVGSWKGKSAAFMAVEIINSGKKIRFDCVDHFLGSDEFGLKDDLDVQSGRLFEVFLRNTAPVREAIQVVRKPSVVAAADYPDRSIDFAMIDGAHDYENVRADIDAWWPKIKSGGVLAGDDYNWEGVKCAVDEAFSMPEISTGLKQTQQWLVRKSDAAFL